MSLQPYNIAVGRFETGQDGENYETGQAVYILTESDTLHPIFEDKDGLTQILQDGVSNVTDNLGEFNFFCEVGRLKARVNGVDRFISVGLSSSSIFNDDGTTAQDTQYMTEENEKNIGEIPENYIFNNLYAGDFSSGFTFTNKQQVARADDGLFYSYNGNSPLPKTFPPSTAYNTNEFYEASADRLENKGEDVRQLIDSLIVPSNDNVIVRYSSGVDQSIYIYVCHSKNWFQRWQITNGNDGFDNNVPTDPNGNMWIVNEVLSTSLGDTDSILGKDVIASGDTDVFGDVLTIYDGSGSASLAGITLVVTFIAKNDGGIADLIVDGVLVSQIDTYNASSLGVSTKVVVDLDFKPELHNIEFKTTGTKNTSSTGFVCRLSAIDFVGAVDYEDLSNITEIARPMSDGQSVFKIGRAALELAVSNTFNGNTVFSGAYHKYCRPKTPDSAKLYLDGSSFNISDFNNGEYLLAKSFKISQSLELLNGADKVANVSMGHTFSGKGLNLKSALRWTESVSVSRFYQSMWPVKGDSVLFGGQYRKISATGSGSSTSLGVYNTYSAAVWNESNDWVSYVSSNNPEISQQKNGSYVGMYMWDRPSDSKIYMRGPNGNFDAGDTFNTDTNFRIGLSPDCGTFLDFNDQNY